MISANRVHAGLVKKDLPGIGKNLILEPVSRNTAPAITLAAALLKKKAGDPVLVVLPSDQYITDERKYLRAIKTGAAFAAKTGFLIVLGLRPPYPATGFGYIKIRSKNAKLKAQSIYKAERFTEKPDLNTAKRFLKDGGYLWNAGIFIFRVSALLKAVKRFAPEIFKGINKSYRGLPDISIDYAVMEKADNIYCVKGAYGWQDIGSFDSLRKVLKKEGRRFVERKGKVIKIL